MLYIIYGASRSGKTLIAKELLKEKQIPYFQLDYFTSALEKIDMPNPIRQGEDFIEKAQKSWIFTKALLSYIATESDDYTIEGDSVLPIHIRELIDEFPHKITAICLGYPDLDVSKKLSTIRNYSHPDDWTDEFDDNAMTPMVHDMIEFSKYLENECERLQIPFYDVGVDFENTHKEILKKLYTM